ncbi:hypothetical protein CC1G_03807 [Coprinopsis cinerea okayama7|uniref:Uncharacterized protein n=1 Tax=Coprinopsis cinerea (strain Okayama-7 / 130 / ATCC MYA-4618 / FGSC 9003) TaxID=240176 RepID=A8NGS9_COPC7|nr:hypothetical protein CC1G_03807 [Coprinopsis cinerea okayama7\|eukprot:XP_001833590.2 hypothetical protein CC1G_03807 [Coprinopsis cinerea okayama7\
MNHEFQMPDVFVVPPEEDEVPGWCCFNAAQPLQEREDAVEDLVPEVGFLDDTDDDASTRKGTSPETLSVVDSLMSSDYNIDHANTDSDSDLDYESEYEEDNQQHVRHHHHDHDQHHNPHSARRDSPRTNIEESGNDSDVIEVVKVSRSKREELADLQVLPPPPGMKRSTTFKAKASKAFRSLSGAFRSSKQSSKPRAADIFPSRPSSRSSYHHQDNNEEPQPLQPGEPRPRTPAARVSRRFSQLFTVKSRNSATSESHVDEMGTPSPSETAFSTRSSCSENPPTDSESQNPLPTATSTRRNSVYQDALTGAPLEPRRPTGGSTRSTTRRFSVVNLQKIFSFSSGQPDSDQHDQTPATDPPQPPEPDVDSGRTTPTLKRKSSSLPSTSSDSSTAPQTPTSTEDIPPVIALVDGGRSSLLHEEARSPLDFESFGKGLGILPSDSNSLQKQPVRPISPETPPLYRRFSSSSYRSSMETTATSIKQQPPQLPPLPEPVRATTLPAIVPGDSDTEMDGKGDVSFEMRLDSLHFDSLSFDADRFIIGDDR